MDSLLIGFAGLGVLVLLIGLRMPIAYSMILVGGVGVTILNGPDIFFSQLKTLAYGQFSTYDLSVVPMFVVMGNISTKASLGKISEVIKVGLAVEDELRELRRLVKAYERTP